MHHIEVSSCMLFLRSGCSPAAAVAASAVQIDEYMAAAGQAVKRVSITSSGAAAEQLTAEDMAGWSKVRQQYSSTIQQYNTAMQHSSIPQQCMCCDV